MVALSTTEAEYTAATEAVKEALWCGLLKSETVGACDVLNKDLSRTCGMHVKRRIMLVTKLLVQVARICAFWN